MSQAKREQLIAEGKLNPDGSRPTVCPTCGQPVDAEMYAQITGGDGAGQANPDAIKVGATAPTPKAEG